MTVLTSKIQKNTVVSERFLSIIEKVLSIAIPFRAQIEADNHSCNFSTEWTMYDKNFLFH